MAQIKEYRNLKVYEQSGANYKKTPTIILKGQWLKECGFEYGTKVVVKCEKNKLIITPVITLVSEEDICNSGKIISNSNGQKIKGNENE